MAKARAPERAKAKKLWEEAQGEISIQDLATRLKKSPALIRKWRKEDGWEIFQKKKPTTKKPHGAPAKNQNATTHGAYATVSLENIPQKNLDYIFSLDIDPEKNLREELMILRAKELDLQSRIETLWKNPNELHLERTVKSENNKGESTTTKTMASTFEQVAKVEAMLGRVQGRLIRVVEAIKALHAERDRADLDQRRHNATLQRITGSYVIDPTTGAIDDSTDGTDLP